MKSRRKHAVRVGWKPGLLTVLIAIIGVGGLVAGLYPMSASWLSSYNQSIVIQSSANKVAMANPSAEKQLALAHAYNDALSAGVVLEENGNVPVSDGTSSDESLAYTSMLSTGGDGMMSRVRIPKIAADLPIYHGTSDEALLRGAGHLEGSHLPVGGIGTRSVITAHRGLANATMFTNLNKVEVGDKIVVETFGEVLTYQVRETQVIAPEATDTLRADPDRDLITLITCTPLGINSHRIIVTAERITPTPIADVREAGEVPSIPGFPWWIVFAAVGLIVITAYVIRQGFVDARVRKRRAAQQGRA